jgi:hypothetical protein
MPAIVFPNLDAVCSALAGGAVPSAVGRGPARVGVDDTGQVWLQPAAAISQDFARALTRVGAAVHRDSAVELADEVGCWPELVPLVPTAVDPADRPSSVLFDLPDAAALPALVAEARRLGAGPVRVRWADLGSPSGGRSEPSARALALIGAPPFHSLLRAENCFYEQAPRVWVEVGWRHPLAKLIEPPVGRIVLLRPPRAWELVVDGPFVVGPESFLLSPRPVAADTAMPLAMPVTLRLVSDHSNGAPELWVLHDRPHERLRSLVEQTDDRLLARLGVAVAAVGGRQVTVLRARPGQAGPPVLVLDALACRPYLRLPNLYVPSGRQLRPPLRRDAARRLLAEDPGQVAWLEPGDGGTFTAHRLPAAAFRPLQELVAYAGDHEPQPLAPAAANRPFTLPPFIARGEVVSPPPRREITPQSELPTPQPGPAGEPPGLLSRIVRWFTLRHGESGQNASPPGPAANPSAEVESDDSLRSFDSWDEQRRTLEERLLTSLTSPNGADRPAPWPELGRLYAALNRPGDAAVCWLNALWNVDDPPRLWQRGWQRAETRAARGDGSDADLRRWLAGPPSPAAVRAIAAAVAGTESPALVESLDQVRRLLEEREGWLPVRAAWLAQLGLGRLSGGDAVGLARARDRLLERLHDHGLSADLDVPAALRFAGQGAGERVDAVRGWLTRAREPIHRWLATRSAAETAEGLTTGHDPRLHAYGQGTAAGPTRAYADLILAWGLARLGERAASQDLVVQARGVLGRLDEAHVLLLDTFVFRIGQALDGRAGGPAPPELTARLDELARQQRAEQPGGEHLLFWKVMRLQQHSRILAPTERIDAFREGWIIVTDSVCAALAALRQVADREELASRLLPIVAAAGRTPDRLPNILAAALDLAPRLGDAIAGGFLDRLLAAVDGWSFAGDPQRVLDEAQALERGLFLAAHFDRPAVVQRLVAAIDRMLEARRDGDPRESRQVEDALLRVVGQGLRGLRRLGLRAETDRLLTRLAEWVVPGGDAAAEHRRRPQAWPLTLRRLLTLAGGWFYLGREGPATEVLDEARRVLFSHELTHDDAHRRWQTDLACAYAAALGQAPARLALARVEELFARLLGVSDQLATNTHYSLSKLRVVEAAVRAVVSDDFALGPAVRRWLDDDEFRVRRRIHRDTRALVDTGR